MTVYIKIVNLTEIPPARKCLLFGPARLKISILQNLYNGLNILGKQRLINILLSTNIMCDVISVQSKTCSILK